jgi:hypothetical protein
MSHSLHRFGTIDSLKKDFCIYARAARGVNRENCGDKLRKILSINLSEKFANFGSSHSGKCHLDGLEAEEYAKTLDDSYGIMVNYSDAEAVTNVLRKLKQADIGISIVVSGLIDEVGRVARDAGLKPHTASLSLGIYGKKSLLSSKSTLQFTTMCGHSLVGTNFVESVIDRFMRGKISSREAAVILAKPCTCGIFNPDRCEAMLEAMKSQAGRGQE